MHVPSLPTVATTLTTVPPNPPRCPFDADGRTNCTVPCSPGAPETPTTGPVGPASATLVIRFGDAATNRDNSPMTTHPDGSTGARWYSWWLSSAPCGGAVDTFRGCFESTEVAQVVTSTPSPQGRDNDVATNIASGSGDGHSRSVANGYGVVTSTAKAVCHSSRGRALALVAAPATTSRALDVGSSLGAVQTSPRGTECGVPGA